MNTKRLVWFLEANNILTNIQISRSTIDQVVRLNSLIRDECVNNEHAVSVFLDLEKAYDTT